MSACARVCVHERMCVPIVPSSIQSLFRHFKVRLHDVSSVSLTTTTLAFSFTGPV